MRLEPIIEDAVEHELKKSSKRTLPADCGDSLAKRGSVRTSAYISLVALISQCEAHGVRYRASSPHGQLGSGSDSASPALNTRACWILGPPGAPPPTLFGRGSLPFLNLTLSECWHEPRGLCCLSLCSRLAIGTLSPLLFCESAFFPFLLGESRLILY